MPLVVMCGFPSSGKSTHCHKLQEEIVTRYPDKTVHVVCDHPEGTDRDSIYSSAQKEKEARGNLKSSVQRLLDKEVVVVLDSMNYIKGFRYELFCVTKSCRSTHCVIYCVTEADTSRQWNKSRPDQYSEKVLDELIMRFECPSPNNRWDAPLFSVLPSEDLDYASICAALFEQKGLRPNQSTQSQPLSATNFLYELDKKTQDVVTALMAAQKTAVPGDMVSFPDAKMGFMVTRPLTLAELQRYRRQFITYTKMHPTEDCSKLSTMFVQYLQKALDN